MEDFITFDLAKKLKEKGFKEKCIAYYWEKINEHTPSFLVEDNMPEDGLNILDLLSNHNQAEWSPFIDAPTISQVLKWLRVDRCFHVSPDLVSDCSVDADGNICEEWTYWSYSIHHIIDGVLYRDYNQFDNIEYQSYEEAAIAGIEYVLENLI